eukprot:2588368-Prymnesium_polylepis.1
MEQRLASEIQIERRKMELEMKQLHAQREAALKTELKVRVREGQYHHAPAVCPPPLLPCRCGSIHDVLLRSPVATLSPRHRHSTP